MSTTATARALPDVQIIESADAGYPALLRDIHDPPEQLYIRGDPSALLRPQLAIVGSRRASAAGLRLAAELAADLVAAGLGVCSGLAMGIDGAAHRGALAAGGTTVGAMATGIDLVYPRRHRGLAQEMTARGCLVTELEPGMGPLPYHFPRRNRIISGLSLGVLVIEAAPASGSLITARCALEQGREVFALPWSPLHAVGRGCLQLLRDGAKMVEGVEHILEELGPLYSLHRERAANDAAQPGPDDDFSLLDLIGCDPVDLDSLVRLSGLPATEVMRELTGLELAGQVARLPGGFVRS